jgi:hypothetical protein
MPPGSPAKPAASEVARLAAAQFAKLGARNSADDLARIQAVHDTCVELGASCEAHKHAGGGNLAKGLDLISAKLDDLLARVRNIESQPLPLPFGGKTRAIAKSEDSGFDREPEDEPIPADRDALALLAIKKAQRMGRSYFTR